MLVSDHLPVSQEAHVLDFVLLAAKQAAEGSDDILGQLLPCVRMPYVPFSRAWALLADPLLCDHPLYRALMRNTLARVFPTATSSSISSPTGTVTSASAAGSTKSIIVAVGASTSTRVTTAAATVSSTTSTLTTATAVAATASSATTTTDQVLPNLLLYTSSIVK
jgi:hypothetical protein